jgi:hypothetical protein
MHRPTSGFGRGFGRGFGQGGLHADGRPWKELVDAYQLQFATVSISQAKK